MDIFREIWGNMPIWTAVLAWCTAQLIKLVIDLSKNRRLNFIWFVSSGGMPSSHCAFVCALATSIGIRQGFGSDMFALGAIISLVVMYDATGVRRAAGRQAVAINMLVDKFEGLGVALDKKLKEMIGHSPLEVFAGAGLGVAIAFIYAGIAG